MRFSGDALYQRRLRKNMSRADLAHAIRHASRDEIKATERGIRGWEKNEYTPHGASVPAIARALDCEIGDLYEQNGNASDDDEESRAVQHRDVMEALHYSLGVALGKVPA
jgi:transcriptional regulator with XRE-family HTH domain